VDSLFLLEILELLVHKIDVSVKIKFFSESSNSIVQFSNINVEYLNKWHKQTMTTSMTKTKFMNVDKLFVQNLQKKAERILNT